MNCNKLGIFTAATTNPQHWVKPNEDLNGKKIIDLYPNAIKALAVYNDGSEVIRNIFPIDREMIFTRGGGSAAITGGSYNDLGFTA